jgi:tetratricopeptide (TPR) repeat protein
VEKMTQQETPEIIQDISSLEQLPESSQPVMNVKDGNSEVYLQSFDIQVEITGNIAMTRYEMVFKNRTKKILEGELLFPLPDGVTVSHYSLDINGKMREAVPVEKAKATQVFEEIEQRRVDPGLLERVEGNNFRTRIYPIPSLGTRTISIGYEEELSAEKGYFYYRLPMAYPESIEKFSLKTTVWRSKTKPKIVGQLAEELIFDEQNDNFTASFSRNDYQANKALVFALPAPTDIPQTLIQQVAESFYFLASCMPKEKTRKKVWGNTLGIIWDASLSGLYRDHAKELDILDKIIKEKKNLSINLYFLSNRITKNGVYKITNGDWSQLRKAIESVVYDGGTNFEAVRLKSISSNEFLFFSDGLSSLSDADFIAKCPAYSGHPVHCIVSSAKADYSTMKWIAAQTNGKFINLNALSADQLQKELMFETLHFMGIEPNLQVREVYPSVTTPVRGNFSIAGILDASQTELVLRFGYGNKVEQRIIVPLDTKESVQQANIQRIWVQKKINELDMRYEQNKKELTELGQQFGIVTRNTSLLVLETMWDYFRYNIMPPPELQAEYFRWKRGWHYFIDDEDKLAANFMMSIIDMDDTQSRLPMRSTIAFVAPDIVDLVSTEEIMENKEVMRKSTSTGSRSEANIPAPLSSANKSSSFESASQPTILRVPIKQDNNYTKELTGNLDDDYAVYLKLRSEYISTPTFYFDMADWFFRCNDRERAIRILTSIADLDIENASLFRLLGYRLKEYGEYAMEVYVCKKVTQWRPMEPQSYRDYALALADNGKYQAALDNLCLALQKSYEQNTWGWQRHAIEEVIRTEISRLIAKHPNLQTGKIPKELLQAMPVDVRVVLNWNMNNVDLDLHVTDPKGENCYYGHRRSAIGGRMSRSVWQGYGPEQFVLEKAIKGKYSVFVNYYGDSQVKTEGPSTAMVEIYTRYADKNEQHQVICLQLSKENKKTKDGKLKVAEFWF